ncbi:MAG: large subunit ribosomal protein [Patescibacteria group bacterium]|nr:large subunit ribosomal protein [Patescibacteria group bacterium]
MAEEKVATPTEKTEQEVENIDTTADTSTDTVVKDSSKLAKPNFKVGDTVIVNYKIKEGEKARIQPFQGIVISLKGSQISKTFTVSRIAAGSIGVERIFPLFSPNIDSIVVKTPGKVKKAKLYYLRKRVGKAALKVKAG